MFLDIQKIFRSGELDSGTKLDQPDQGEVGLHYLETCTTLWCISLWRLIHYYSTVVKVPSYVNVTVYKGWT